MVETLGPQLAWDGAFALYLVWLLCLWNRKTVDPQTGWTFEALALLLAQALVGSLYLLLEAHSGPQRNLFALAGCLVGVGWWCAYWVLRWSRCRGDRLLLPLAALLSGIGWVLQLRLSQYLAFRQAAWLLVGLACLIGLATFVRNLAQMRRWRWHLLGLCLILQFGLFLFGEERNGAALWYVLGPLSLQPIEVVKVLVVCLLVSFAPAEGRRIRRRQLAGFGLAWLVLELLMVAQRDLGVALLFYGVFLVLLYIGSGRVRWVLALLALSALGALGAYIRFGHVRVRVEAWMDPLASYHTSGYQISEAMFALAQGGWLGTGFGSGQPWRVPEVATDFIYIAWCEEFGVVGGCLLWVALTMFLLRTFLAGQRGQSVFDRRLAIGLATLLTWQSCIVLFGVLKLMPMTGITLPFLSYGGSSLLANFGILALLQRVSQSDA